jgi:hypothetical protein
MQVTQTEGDILENRIRDFIRENAMLLDAV